MEKRLNKRIFNEQFIIIDQIDKESFSNTKLIKNHILSNFSLDARYKDDQYWYMFEYDNGRDKHRRWKVPLQKDKFIICSSSLNRYITRNTDKDFLVNLSLHFQLI